jgi:alkyl hydroperoxide reductase subunit AhpC
MPDGSFKTLSLGDFAGKYLVLLFYPMDWTFVCPTELTAFSDRTDEFQALNTEVVAVSVDTKFSHHAWLNTPRDQGGLGKMRIPLLSDITKQISRDYGVLLDAEDGDDAGVALRGLFVISGEGVVRSVTINDLPVGRSVDEVLRTVKAFLHTDTHGEVCPANWVPGAATIKDNPTDKLEFFQAQEK